MTGKNKELEWVITGGGPLVVIPSELAREWRGDSPPAGVTVPEGWLSGTDGIVTDYGRACDMDDSVSVGDYHSFWAVPVGGGRALLLDGETSTAAVPWGDGVVLLRDADVETEAQADELLAALPPDAWRESSYDLDLRDGRLFVFDAAYEGSPTAAEIAADGGVLDIPLEPGRYRVHHAAPGEPDTRIALLRLSRA